MDYTLAKAVAIDAVTQAGKVIMDNFPKETDLSFKGRSDVVTNVDLESEAAILACIKNTFPDHNILSEESGWDNQQGPHTWVVDPLDGTINYYYKSSPFRTGVCLLEDKKPVLTAILNPLKEDLYFAQKGCGATLNGEKITVNANANLKNSVIMTHLSSKKEARMRTILALENLFVHSLHIRMFGGGLAAMNYVARGMFDVFLNVQTNPWDILPGTLLVEEAGGRVTDISGQPITPESTSVLATNGLVHDEMLALLSHM